MEKVYANPIFAGLEDTEFSIVGSATGKVKTGFFEEFKMFWLLYKPRKHRKIEKTDKIEREKFEQTVDHIAHLKLDLSKMNGLRKPSKKENKEIQESHEKETSSISVSKEQVDAMLRLVLRTPEEEVFLMNYRSLQRKIDKIRAIDFSSITFEQAESLFYEITTYAKTHQSHFKGASKEVFDEFVGLKDILLVYMRQNMVEEMHQAEGELTTLLQEKDEVIASASIAMMKQKEQELNTAIRKYFISDGDLTSRFEKFQEKLIETMVKMNRGEKLPEVIPTATSEQEEVSKREIVFTKLPKTTPQKH